MSKPIALREYQKKLVAAIRQEFANGHKNVLAVLPTGGGKTYSFAYIAQQMGLNKKRVLILAHRQELVMQASLSLASIGVRHAIVAAHKTEHAIRAQHVREFGKVFVDQSELVSVASVQTVIRRLNLMGEFQLLIHDEAHHSVSGTHRKTVDHFIKARLLGVTATPVRTDGQGLGSHCGGVYDAMVLGPSVPELIELGNLVPARVFYPGTPLDLSEVRQTAGGDYNAQELISAMQKQRPTITGDAVAHYREHAHGKKVIVFCASVAAAQDAAEKFCQAGYKFRSLDGTMEDSDRLQVVRDLRSGELDGITSCDIVSEGFDLPALEVAILLRPTKSESLFLQQCGRILRPSEGKEWGLVFDHVGNTMIHGLPHWERMWTLDGRPKGKRNTDEIELKLRVCPKCFACHETAPECPRCGHVYVINSRDIKKKEGALRELEEREAEKLKEEIRRKQNRGKQGGAKSFPELFTLAGEQGKKESWSYYVARARGIPAAKIRSDLLQILRGNPEARRIVAQFNWLLKKEKVPEIAMVELV